MIAKRFAFEQPLLAVSLKKFIFSFGKMNFFKTTINGQPSTDNHQRTTINGQPSTDNHQRTTINGQPSTDNHQRTTINGQPSTDNQPTVANYPCQNQVYAFQEMHFYLLLLLRSYKPILLLHRQILAGLPYHHRLNSWRTLAF